MSLQATSVLDALALLAYLQGKPESEFVTAHLTRNSAIA